MRCRNPRCGARASGRVDRSVARSARSAEARSKVLVNTRSNSGTVGCRHDADLDASGKFTSSSSSHDATIATTPISRVHPARGQARTVGPRLHGAKPIAGRPLLPTGATNRPIRADLPEDATLSRDGSPRAYTWEPANSMWSARPGGIRLPHPQRVRILGETRNVRWHPHRRRAGRGRRRRGRWSRRPGRPANDHGRR